MSDPDGAVQKPANPAPTVRARRGWGWPGILLLLLFAGGAGAAGAYYYPLLQDTGRVDQLEQRLAAIEATAVTDRDLRGDLNALDTRIGRMEDRVNRLEIAAGAPRPAPAPAPSNATDPRVGQLTTRLENLENRLPDDLATRLSSAPTRAEQEEMAARLTALENSNSNVAMRRAATILALSELSDAATRAEPFAAELEAAASLAPNDATIRTLRGYAAAGAPTMAQLTAEFPTLARQALQDDATGEDQGLLMQLWSRITQFVSIRRVGNVDGTDSDAIIARAESALNADDLGSAVAEIRSLQGPAANGMASWLNRAEARVAVDSARSEINARIVETLAGSNSASTVP
jgi:hypothetical protein